MLLFLSIAWLAIEIVQIIRPAELITNQIWEALLLGITSLLWTLVQELLSADATVSLASLILVAITGSILAAISSSIFWYFTDSTGKGRYTLRHLYILLGVYRLILYSISIVLGAIPAMI
jgi:hypothetical protein